MRKPEQESDLQAAGPQDESDDTFHRIVYEAPEQKRCELLHSMWRDKFLFQVADTELGEILCGSQPLVRVFTISNELVAQKLKWKHDIDFVDEKVVASQTEKILSSIQDSVQSNYGVVASGDVETEVCSEFPFLEFGNDGFVIGLFFSRDSRNTATDKILTDWKAWGVGTEINLTELQQRQEWRENFQQCFDDSEVRSRLNGMSHEERLQEIQVLWQQGVAFEMTDPDMGTKYSSVGSDIYFYVDYSLGIVPPCDRSDCSFPIDKSIIREYMEFLDDEDGERMRTIVQIERTIRDDVEVNGGEVFVFERMLHENEDGTIIYEGPSSTMIGCRFPTEAVRNQFAREILDSLSIYGVEIDEDTREVIMNLNERIAYAAWMKARIESDPDRENQLRLMKGPAFDELKEQVINNQIANWESTQKEKDT